MMRLTLSEVEATATRAARGAGFSWGLAEEAAFAAHWLVEQGIDGLALLLARLDLGTLEPAVMATGRWTGPGPLCPIATGASLGDAFDLPEGLASGALSLSQTAIPALMLPFLARRDVVTVTWPGFRGLLTGGALLTLEGDLTCPLAEVALSRSPRHMPQPIEIDPQVVEALQVYVRRTYVPASDASRRGAGAMGSDNA